MTGRPFFTELNQHADGPPRYFGQTAHTLHPVTPEQRRMRNAPPVGALPALQSLLYVLVVALFFITFTVQPIRIPSASMQPTLLIGDFLLLDKQSVASDAHGLLPPTGIARGDVIVFHDPVEDTNIHLVKRVVGLPGDQIFLRDGVVYLNGRALAEPYAVHHAGSRTSSFRDDFPSLEAIEPEVNPGWWSTLRTLVHAGAITVPPGEYFVLGDNRDESEDSRYWGFVPRDAIVGKPLLIYFSLTQPAGKQPSEQQPEQSGPFAGRDTQGSAANMGPADFARWDRTFRIVR